MLGRNASAKMHPLIRMTCAQNTGGIVFAVFGKELMRVLGQVEELCFVHGAVHGVILDQLPIPLLL